MEPCSRVPEASSLFLHHSNNLLFSAWLSTEQGKSQNHKAQTVQRIASKADPARSNPRTPTHSPQITVEVSGNPGCWPLVVLHMYVVVRCQEQLVNLHTCRYERQLAAGSLAIKTPSNATRNDATTRRYACMCGWVFRSVLGSRLCSPRITCIRVMGTKNTQGLKDSSLPFCNPWRRGPAVPSFA